MKIKELIEHLKKFENSNKDVFVTLWKENTSLRRLKNFEITIVSDHDENACLEIFDDVALIDFRKRFQV